LFVECYAKKDVKSNQNWNLYIGLTAKKIKDRYLVSVSLVNDSQVFSGRSRKSEDPLSIETMFNSGMSIHLDNAKFEDILLDYFADDTNMIERRRA